VTDLDATRVYRRSVLGGLINEYAPPHDRRKTAGHQPNRIFERHRIGGCRRELLDRTLIWNQSHLRRILRQYETHHNQHRPHRSLDAAAPLKPLPEPVDLGQYRTRRQPRVGGTINEYRLVA
jgi:putative transposase